MATERADIRGAERAGKHPSRTGGEGRPCDDSEREIKVRALEKREYEIAAHPPRSADGLRWQLDL